IRVKAPEGSHVGIERRVCGVRQGVAWGAHSTGRREVRRGKANLERDDRSQTRGDCAMQGRGGRDPIDRLRQGAWMRHGSPRRRTVVVRVPAERRFTHANEQENPDLFWGVRGGGGNFGVATSFEFRLHPVGAILGGVLVHPMGRARELLRFYSKFVEGAPDELTLFAALGTSPDGVPVAVILAGYFGPLDEGERILR